MVSPNLSTSRVADNAVNSPTVHAADHNTMAQAVNLLDLTTAPVLDGELLLHVNSGVYGPFVAAGSSATGTADIATINAALAAAEATGATVLIPAHARVTVTAPLHGNLITARAGVTLKSEGAVIKVADSSPVYNSVIDATGDVSGFCLDGVTIDQNKDNAAVPTLTTNEYAFAVHLVSGTNLRVKNCTFKNVAGINTVVMNGSSGTNGVVNIGNVFITDNVFDNVGTSSTFDHSTVYTNAKSATISRNHFYGRSAVAKNATCAIEVHGSSHRIVGNHIENYREGVNATGIAWQTDTQIVAHNTIRRVMRGVRAFSQALAGTVTPGIRAMQISNNSIIIDPDFWAATFAEEVQGVSYTSTQDLAVDGLNIQNNSIVFLPYTGTSTAVATALSGGVVYSRTGGTTNYDRAIDISANTIIGPLSSGVICFGLKVQGLAIHDNLILDAGHASLVASDEYKAGVCLATGEAIGCKVRTNMIVDTRGGGGTTRGVAWFVSSGSVDGEVVDNHIKLVTTGQREVRINTTSGAPLVKHVTRTTGATTTLPSGDCEVGSEWVILSTGVKSVQVKAPTGAVWLAPTSTTAARPSAADAKAGTSYWDTTLNKPAWSDGTNWKDATGATV